MNIHEMIPTVHQEDGDTLFECPICPRRLVFRRTGERVIIYEGDASIPHLGALGPIRMTAEVRPA